MTRRPISRWLGPAAPLGILLVALTAVSVGGGACGEGATAVSVRIIPDPGLSFDELRVEVVAFDGAGGFRALEPESYAGFDAETAWPQTLALLPGEEYAARATVSVAALLGGKEVARGGVQAAFSSGKVVTVDLPVTAACRGVFCQEGSFCGAGGQCEPDGRRLDFTMNLTTTGDQLTPGVAPLGTDGFVVVWADSSAGRARVVGRRFDVAGRPLDADELTIAGGALGQSNPAVAGRPNGDGWVVAWEEEQLGGVRARRFDADGNAVGGAEPLTSVVTAHQGSPAVGATSGGFLVAWQDAKPITGVGWSIRYRRGFWDVGWLDTSATYAALAPTAQQTVPAVAGGCSGDESYLVAWEDGSGSDPDYSGTQVRGRWVTPGGADDGESILNTLVIGDQRAPRAASGSAVAAVIWEETGEAAPETAGVRGRLCSASGLLLTAEILVASTGGREVRPDVAVANDIVFVVWEGEIPEGESEAASIMGRRLDASGSMIDDEPFVVSEARLGGLARPRVAGVGEAFVVVWQEHDGSDWDVRGRVVRATGEP